MEVKINFPMQKHPAYVYKCVKCGSKIYSEKEIEEDCQLCNGSFKIK